MIIRNRIEYKWIFFFCINYQEYFAMYFLSVKAEHAHVLVRHRTALFFIIRDPFFYEIYIFLIKKEEVGNLLELYGG